MGISRKGTWPTAGLALVALAAAACGSSSVSGGSSASGPVKVGMVYEKTGIYSAYAQEYYQGFNIGLAYATHGTGKVAGHKVDVTWEDDADSATTAVTDFKSLVGAGDKIVGGTLDSGIATQLAPLAAQNQVLYISGGAAADQITGLASAQDRPARHRLCPRDRDVFTRLTVRENLRLAEIGRAPRYEQVYDLFPELRQRSRQLAGTLSGGQQQMLAIGRVLLHQRPLLLVDEPTKGLSPLFVSEVVDVLERIAATCTILMVEQNVHVVRKLARQVIVLDHGVVVHHGPVSGLSEDGLVRRLLGVSGPA